MSHNHSHPHFDCDSFDSKRWSPTGRLAPLRQHADRAIDAALRQVSLPDGFLTRLGELAYAMPCEAEYHALDAQDPPATLAWPDLPRK